MTSRRQDLFRALVQVQNHPAHDHHDILTITACAPAMTEAELERHLDANMATIARWSDRAGSKRRLARAA